MSPDPVGSFRVRPVTENDVREFSAWRNDPPYEVYDITGHSVEENVAYFLSPEVNGHVLVDEDDALFGFITFGEDARVPGGDYSAPGIDIGLGIRPDATGRGNGSRFVATVIAFATEAFEARTLRVTVAEWNTRALRVWEGADFDRSQRFETPPDFKALGAGAFIVLERQAST